MGTSFFVPKVPNINIVNSSIFDSPENALLVNFTFNNDNKLFGHSWSGESNFDDKKFGDIFSSKIDNHTVLNVCDRNFVKENVSYTKLRYLFDEVKTYMNDNNYKDVYFNEVNLIQYNLHKIMNIISKVFDDGFKVFICSKSISDQLIKHDNTITRNNINTCSKAYFDHNLPFIECKINNIVTAGMIDTGANVCLVDYDFLINNNFSFNTENDSNITGITYDSLNVKGKFNYQLLIGSNQYDITCYVVKDGNLDVPFLFGCDFLDKYKISINFSTKIISIDNNNIKFLKPNALVFK